MSPIQQSAHAQMDAWSRASEHRSGGRLMRISKAIGHDPVRLAGAIRNADADAMCDLCTALIRTHQPDFDGDVTELVQALSLICNTAAKDE